jgi:hypothetical protein
MKMKKELIGKVITASVNGQYGDYKVCSFIQSEKKVVLRRMNGTIEREILCPSLNKVT